MEPAVTFSQCGNGLGYARHGRLSVAKRAWHPDSVFAMRLAGDGGLSMAVSFVLAFISLFREKQKACGALAFCLSILSFLIYVQYLIIICVWASLTILTISEGAKPTEAQTSVTIQVQVGDAPIPEDLVIVKSLEKPGNELLRAHTNKTGNVPPVDLKPGLYRAIATTPYGLWVTAAREFLVKPGQIEMEVVVTTDVDSQCPFRRHIDPAAGHVLPPCLSNCPQARRGNAARGMPKLSHR